MMRRLAVLCACSLLFAACGDDGNPSTGPDGATNSAVVNITSPDDGDEVKISKGVVKIDVSGFTLANKMGLDPEDGEGHVVYYIWNGYGPDGTTYQVPQVPGQPANSGGTGFVALASAEKENHWRSFLQPGKQKWAVQLVNNDNTPLEPPVVDEITVTVTGKPATPEPRDEDGGPVPGSGQGGGGGGGRGAGGGPGAGDSD
jgi:hypothetical protein